MQSSLNWFEIFVADLPRATRFYEATLNGKLRHEKSDGMEMAILPYAEPGVGGALCQSSGLKPGDGGTRIYLPAGKGEAALDAAVRRAREAGGMVTLAKQAIGPHGWIALVRDTEGNTIGLHAAP